MSRGFWVMGGYGLTLTHEPTGQVVSGAGARCYLLRAGLMAGLRVRVAVALLRRIRAGHWGRDPKEATAELQAHIGGLIARHDDPRRHLCEACWEVVIHHSEHKVCAACKDITQGVLHIRCELPTGHEGHHQVHVLVPMAGSLGKVTWPTRIHGP